MSKSSKRTASLVVMASAWLAGAQDVKQESAPAQPARRGAAARPNGAQTQFAPPPAQPADDQPKQIVGRMAPPHAGPNQEAGRLGAATLVSVEAEQAQVRLADGTVLTLQVGTNVDGDVVKTVRGRHVVLERPARPGQPGGTALVVVDFRDGGGARTLVLWSAYPGLTPERPTGGR